MCPRPRVCLCVSLYYCYEVDGGGGGGDRNRKCLGGKRAGPGTGRPSGRRGQYTVDCNRDRWERVGSGRETADVINGRKTRMRLVRPNVLYSPTILLRACKDCTGAKTTTAYTNTIHNRESSLEHNIFTHLKKKKYQNYLLLRLCF